MINMTDFKGEIPRRNRTMLPQGYAEASQGARLQDGTLSPYRESTLEQAVSAGTQAIYRHNGAWLTFPSRAQAAQGPIADDRLYIMGDGAPKMRVAIGGTPTDVALALDGPPVPPTATPVDPQTDPTLNDPSAAISLTGYNVADGVAEGSGVPYSLVIVRQPEPGLSGKTLVTQPAILVLDQFGEICTEFDNFSVSVVAAPDFAGTVIGVTTKAPDATGVVRFEELSASTPSIDDGLVLEFYARGLQSVFSERIFLPPDQFKIAKDIVFAYTYVTEFDEESAPSIPSAPVFWYPDLEVEIGEFTFPQIDRRIDRVRVYRSETSLSGVTDLYFVKEIDLVNPHTVEISVPSGKFVYLQADHPIAEILTSNDYDPPEDDFEGIVAMPNGMMAAFRGREIAFSEPYVPHAWPVRYRLTVDSDIMGLVPMGSSLAIITADKPYVAQGLHPASMVMEKIDQSLPCVSKASVVDLGYGAAYSSHRGIVAIQSGSGASVISEALFSREQWRAFRPATVVATAYEGRYLFSYQDATDNDAVRTGLLDLTGQMPFFSNVGMAAKAWFEDAASGELFYIPDDAAQIRKWDAATGDPISYAWKSSVIRTNAFINFGAIVVRTDAPNHSATIDLELDVYADGQKVATITKPDQPSRLPSGFLAQDWQVEAKGNATITGIHIAGDMMELVQ